MKRSSRGMGAVAGAFLLIFSGALAAQLPKTEFKAIGYTSNTYMWFDLEKPFYEKTLPEISGGAIKVQAIPHDQAGIKGPEVLRLLEEGVLQIASQNASYMAGDDPRFEGLDLAGLTLVNTEAFKVTQAYKPVIARIMKEKFKVKLLGLGPNPAQVFWCNTPMKGLKDLKGKKIRVMNPTGNDFVTGAGGTPVAMPFTEVVPALQRGVVDCAVTGTLNGNTAKWPEVTTHLYPMNLGWAIVFWAANEDFWNKLNPKVQTILDEQFKKFEKRVWDIGAEVDKDGIVCSTGGACQRGTPAKMTLVPVSKADAKEHARIVDDFVIKNWAKRCGAACAKEWNETIGKVIGKKAPTNF